MADLATAEDLALQLGLSESAAAAQEELLTLLLDGAEDLFESEADRVETPFQDAQTGRIEVHDGFIGTKLLLDYPIASISAIAIGVDVASASETLAPADAAKVVWRVGQRVLTRTDGGVWSAAGGTVLSWARGGPLVPDEFDERPSFVQVTYTTQADLPTGAKLAVLRLAAQLFQQKDRGGVDSEQLDNYAVTYTNMSTFVDAARKDPAWAIAVARHRRLVAL